MKINSINQQSHRQNFSGSLVDKTAKLITKHPGAVAMLAGSSVIAQKIVMSGSETIVGPAMDIAIGKTITKVTGEKDGRTNQSAKVQAIRTFAQSLGGTIVGIAIRAICIGLATYGVGKLGAKAGEKLGGSVADILNPNKLSSETDKFLFKQNASAWGKNIGGALATIVMLGTNFVIDAPFINMINKKTTKALEPDKKEKMPPATQTDENQKEVK